MRYYIMQRRITFSCQPKRWPNVKYLCDGEVVKVGDQFNDSKVVAIKADKVVMDDASKSLRTTPDVEKKKPVVSKSRKKSVMIPEASVSSKAQ